jgi:hypothetical protein
LSTNADSHGCVQRRRFSTKHNASKKKRKEKKKEKKKEKRKFARYYPGPWTGASRESLVPVHQAEA